MNQTQSKLEQLLKLSHRLSFNAQYICGSVCLKKAEDCALITEFYESKIPDIDFDTDSYSFEVNDDIEYRVTLHHTGQQFASYENFILHHYDLSKESVLDENFVIFEEIHMISMGNKPISQNLKLFYKFIKCLASKYYHRDNQIIFFSQTHCEITIQPRRHEEYVQLAKLYNELGLADILNNFIDWLSTEKTSKENSAIEVHQSERYAIAATEFIDHLSTFNKNEKLYMLLKNVDDIYKSTLSKYSLYLDDFKYSKFIEKITKHSEDFLVKINKVISDLQNQILAIPLALSVITVFKESDKVNVYIYIAFLFYLLMVFYSCCQQAYNIDHIKIQINQFNEIAKLPKELAPEWKKEIKPINKKILWHQIFLITISLCIGLLIGVCIINIEL
ncbi:hypothetical protein [Acinetobacter sp. YH12135]|jgi:hypothetical protein|uniref:hypothetical protein n=1 Tax=Acinetobacter TaxID=469 RepID=UPI0015D2226E|nr:hypothetical protein [Acinetobacter sp. YH12135]